MFVGVLVASFAVLGWVGVRIYQEMPPIVERVATPHGTTVIDAGEIVAGQKMRARKLGGIGIHLLLASLLVVIPLDAKAHSRRPFVPEDFQVPKKLETERFLLRMLTVNDVVKDYDAVMRSVDNFRGVFGPQSIWPKPDLTLEQDLIDLGWHQKESLIRRSFAYTVMNLSETECLGCVPDSSGCEITTPVAHQA